MWGTKERKEMSRPFCDSKPRRIQGRADGAASECRRGARAGGGGGGGGHLGARPGEAQGGALTDPRPLLGKCAPGRTR